MTNLPKHIDKGGIFVLKEHEAQIAYEPDDIFGKARLAAHFNPGDVVLFRGVFPDGRERVQATIAVPSGEGSQQYKEKLADRFNAAVEDVTANHFTRDGEGYHYVSLTADI